MDWAVKGWFNLEPGDMEVIPEEGMLQAKKAWVW